MPLIVSVMATSAEQFAPLVAAVAERDEVAALELNVSCPNVHSGLIVGEEPGETAALMRRLRPLTAKPLIVKLTPNVAEPAAIAIAAEQGGADAVSLINTIKAAPMLRRRHALARGRERRPLGSGGPVDRAEAGRRRRRGRRDPGRRDGRRRARQPRRRAARRRRGGRSRSAPRAFATRSRRSGSALELEALDAIATAGAGKPRNFRELGTTSSGPRVDLDLRSEPNSARIRRRFALHVAEPCI